MKIVVVLLTFTPCTIVSIQSDPENVELKKLSSKNVNFDEALRRQKSDMVSSLPPQFLTVTDGSPSLAFFSFAYQRGFPPARLSLRITDFECQFVALT